MHSEQREKASTGLAGLSHCRRPSAAPARPGDRLDAIVAELAEILRLRARLRDAELRQRLDEDDNAPSTEELDDTLLEKQAALESLASLVEARTINGAMLQALLSLNAMAALSDLVALDGDRRRFDRHARARRLLARLLFSAAWALFDLSGDRDGEAGAAVSRADLKALIEHYAPRGFHDLDQIERLRSPAWS
ncbi:MAG TPA: hypothetical protein VGG29_00250 [Caulobacteraceae bacterium]|jgi:hypothetical protein